MITRLVMLEGIEHTILNPVANCIIDDINNNIIKDTDVKVYRESMYSEENNDLDDHVYNNTIGKSKLFVNTEFEDNDELNLTTSYYKARERTILLDPHTGFNIRPVSINTDITFSFIYKSKSKLAVNKVKSKLQQYYNTGGYSMPHKVEYSFILPKTLMKLMSNISDLEDQPDVYAFIDSCKKVSMDYAIKPGSLYKVPTIRSTQSGIIGNIMDEPKSIKIGKEDQLYTIEFSYLVTFNKPTALGVQYPITVNNKPIDEVWLPNESIANPTDAIEGSFDIRSALKQSIVNNTYKYDIIYKIPSFDQFLPEAVNGYNSRIKLVSIMLELDSDNPNILFNIDDLQYIGIPDYIIEYFKSVGAYDLFKFGYSLFHIELYEGNYIKDKGLMKDTDNNIVTTKDMDATKVYHLLISVLTNRRYLTYSRYDPYNKMDKDIELMEKMGIMFKDDTFVMVTDNTNNNGY